MLCLTRILWVDYVDLVAAGINESDLQDQPCGVGDQATSYGVRRSDCLSCFWMILPVTEAMRGQFADSSSHLHGHELISSYLGQHLLHRHRWVTKAMNPKACHLAGHHSREF